MKPTDHQSPTQIILSFSPATSSVILGPPQPAQIRRLRSPTLAKPHHPSAILLLPSITLTLSKPQFALIPSCLSKISPIFQAMNQRGLAHGKTVERNRVRRRG